MTADLLAGLGGTLANGDHGEPAEEIANLKGAKTPDLT
jgi:hypothetical protein